MPCIAPSHQAPAFLLKQWRPTLFSGLALALGTLAPDLEFIFRIQSDWVVSHTLAAQLYFTAPLTVLLYWLSVELVLPWLVPFLPAGAPFYLGALARLGRPRRAAWASVAVSGAVGGLTHIFLDGFTHGGRSGWAVAFLPFLRSPVPGLALPLHDGLQAALSLGLGIYALELWRRRARERAGSVGSNPRPAEARALLAATVLIAAAAGVAFARQLHPTAMGLEALELEAYGGADFVALAIVVGAAWDRFRADASTAPALFDGV
jgi:membrane-bound metal-dependent hydrolase YbcI (DUF457 family)